jgi:hypothetical protein
MTVLSETVRFAQLEGDVRLLQTDLDEAVVLLMRHAGVSGIYPSEVQAFLNGRTSCCFAPFNESMPDRCSKCGDTAVAE